MRSSTGERGFRKTGRSCLFESVLSVLVRNVLVIRLVHVSSSSHSTVTFFHIFIHHLPTSNNNLHSRARCSLRVTVNKYTPTSFGYDDAKIQQLIKAARDKGYDGEATRLEAIKPALEKSIRTMKNLTATIGSKVDVLNTATLTLATVLMHIRKDTEPLVATAKSLLTASTSCGFVKGIYESM